MGESTDIRGHRVDSSNDEAVSAFNEGIHSFVTWRTDSFAHLDRAIELDPEFDLAKLAKGWMLQTARSDKFKPAIRQLLDAASGARDKGDDRLRAYYDGLDAAVEGEGVRSGTLMECMLEAHPTDLFAHRLVQFELFWNGRSQWMRDIAERAASHWTPDVYDYGCFLSVRAFSNEESGEYELAERCGREAVEIDPGDCWGTHAIAHVLVMQGRIGEGVDWLEGLSGNWGNANQMRHHLWWHLCLFLLERGEHERIFELLTSQIRNPESPLVQAVPDATIDIQNVASLLLRLELRGIDVGDHWQMLADVCAERVHNHANAFSNAHDMMVLAATGQLELANELLQSMQAAAARSTNTLTMSYQAAGNRACEAVLAHRLGQFERVVDLLSSVRHDLAFIGGSHAQRDVFYQLLVDAARRSGREQLIPQFLSDVERIGFGAVDERTLYRDAVAH